MNHKRRSGSWAPFSAVMLVHVAELGCVAAGATEQNVPAQSTQGPLTFEVTPYLGYPLGGTFKLIDTGTQVDVDNHVSYALALDLSADEGKQYEVFYSRQSTTIGGQSLAPSDMVIEYLQVGGTVLLENSQGLLPYLVGGVGVTRFAPNSPISRDSEHFSASLGAGLRIPFNSHFSLRLEARGFATILNSNSAIFCRSDQSGGVCRIHERGSSFIQGELLAGVAYAF
jgi:opacity protein-like surface antigen